MAEYSRVKKYENLRKEIENDKNVSSLKSDLLDSSKILTKKETYTPVHRKNFDNDNKMESNDSTFKNEYLDSFIQEVREYNIQKGLRESEDTKLDILQQLSSKNREKRSNYISQIEDKVDEFDHMFESLPNEDENVLENQTLEISRQVFELINENNEVKEVNEVKDSKEEIKEVQSELDARIADLEREIEESNLSYTDEVSNLFNKEEEEVNSEEDDEITKKELLEQTLELKAKVESYKEELNEINEDVADNNKLLNIIIVILVLALLGVIGVVIYWLISGGII